jgi:hypothetical protein
MTPVSPPIGTGIEKVEVLLRNVGTEPCSGAGKVVLRVTDSDNKIIEEIASLFVPGITVPALGEKQVDFIPGPDTSGLREGTYGLLVTAYCADTFQDQKTFFFSTAVGEFASIPETGVTAVLSVLTIVVLLLFNSKK